MRGCAALSAPLCRIRRTSFEPLSDRIWLVGGSVQMRLATAEAGGGEDACFIVFENGERQVPLFPRQISTRPVVKTTVTSLMMREMRVRFPPEV